MCLVLRYDIEMFSSRQTWSFVLGIRSLVGLVPACISTDAVLTQGASGHCIISIANFDKRSNTLCPVDIHRSGSQANTHGQYANVPSRPRRWDNDLHGRYVGADATSTRPPPTIPTAAFR